MQAETHSPNRSFLLRVMVKAALLFVVLNAAFALIGPLPALGRVSVYNVLVPGRERLPYGENVDLSYNLSLNSVEAMFASHEVSAPKAADEFRVLLMGDSSVWGFLLRPADTLAGQINAVGMALDDGRRVVAYNLGYPIMSLAKDLLLLDTAMQFQPDMIVWLMTLESFPRDEQLYPPLVQHNPDALRRLIAAYNLNIDPNDERFVDRTFLERTLVGQRRELADWLRLQLLAPMWASTRIDQHYPDMYTPRQEDFDEDESWHGFDAPQTLTTDDLAFDVLAAGVERAGDVPILLINEPMFISDGQNSDLRYNAFYPRWAYDQYRELLTDTADENGWALLDLWDAVPTTEFTDSAVHLTPEGSRLLAEMVTMAASS